MQWIADQSMYEIFIEPWRDYGVESFWVVLMGFLVGGACGLVGVFTVLRRMSLIGDALSHSLLPGIAVAFLLTSARSTSVLFIGAIVAALVAVFLIEYIPKRTGLKVDAVMGVVFSALFALGVVIITVFADDIDLDTECVLYGEIAFVALEDPLQVGGMDIGPYPVVRMGGVLMGLGVLLVIFYRPLVLSVFDRVQAHCMGIKSGWVNGVMTGVLALVIVSAFKSVGAILVVAMLLLPGATGLLLSSDLKKVLWGVLPLAGVYSVLGYHLAIYLDASIAGCMASVGFGIFMIAVVFYCIKRRCITKNQKTP